MARRHYLCGDELCGGTRVAPDGVGKAKLMWLRSGKLRNQPGILDIQLSTHSQAARPPSFLCGGLVCLLDEIGSGPGGNDTDQLLLHVDFRL